MDIVDRLNLFLEHQSISKSQFADSCGIPRPTTSQILSGRNKKISDEIISKIHSVYPELSILWLMFGEGSMLPKENPNEKQHQPHLFSTESESEKDAIVDSPSPASNYTAEIHLPSVESKRVSKILVFYTDNSFQEFRPV